MLCKGFMNFSQNRYKIIECQSHGLLQPAGMFDNVLCDIWGNTKSMTSLWLGVFFFPGYTQPQFIPFLPKGEVEYKLIKLCLLNWEGNQYKRFSTQIEDVEAKKHLQWPFLEYTWETTAAFCSRINFLDLFITYPKQL